jgi:hypothetical protein
LSVLGTLYFDSNRFRHLVPLYVNARKEFKFNIELWKLFFRYFHLYMETKGIRVWVYK